MGHDPLLTSPDFHSSLTRKEGGGDKAVDSRGQPSLSSRCFKHRRQSRDVNRYHQITGYHKEELHMLIATAQQLQILHDPSLRLCETTRSQESRCLVDLPCCSMRHAALVIPRLVELESPVRQFLLHAVVSTRPECSRKT